MSLPGLDVPAAVEHPAVPQQVAGGIEIADQTTQKFTLNGSHDLVNPQANKCVTADGTGNGARLTLRSCNGTPSQKWRKA